MKVLMFGWEFPPYSSGGLGTACYALTKSLSRKNVSITFVLPHAIACEYDFLKMLSPRIRIMQIDSMLNPYFTPKSYHKAKNGRYKPNIYGDSLFDEVNRYSQEAKIIAESEDFDVIHCHDWMTFNAGINAKKAKNKPLIVHVHSTEFDRTGGNHTNAHVYGIEKEGMEFADEVVAVSNYTKNKIVQNYGVHPEKITVVHNSVDPIISSCEHDFEIKKHDRVVLFLGRITLQKGPDYFLYAAKKVLERESNVKFIIAGSGDMEPFIIEKAAELGISKNVLFAGFLEGDDVDKAYKMADLYVMPSVSEPFGITALEAMRNGTPVIISKQSGVAEVVKNCLTANFWDVNDIAGKILAVLSYNPLHESLKENSLFEIKGFNWDTQAEKCVQVYNKLAVR